MNRARPGKTVKVLEKPEAPAEASIDATANMEAAPVVGGQKEAVVLSALDPFWTRGIVLPGAGEKA